MDERTLKKVDCGTERRVSSEGGREGAGRRRRARRRRRRRACLLHPRGERHELGGLLGGVDVDDAARRHREVLRLALLARHHHQLVRLERVARLRAVEVDELHRRVVAVARKEVGGLVARLELGLALALALALARRVGHRRRRRVERRQPLPRLRAAELRHRHRRQRLRRPADVGEVVVVELLDVEGVERHLPRPLRRLGARARRRRRRRLGRGRRVRRLPSGGADEPHAALRLLDLRELRARQRRHRRRQPAVERGQAAHRCERVELQA